MKISDTLQWVILIGAAAWLYHWKQKIPTPEDAKRAANELWNLINIHPVRVTGHVSLPGNEMVPLNSIAQGSGVDPDGFFTWQGILYKISGRDGSGNYIAMRAS